MRSFSERPRYVICPGSDVPGPPRTMTRIAPSGEGGEGLTEATSKLSVCAAAKVAVAAARAIRVGFIARDYRFNVTQMLPVEQALATFRAVGSGKMVAQASACEPGAPSSVRT